MDDSRRHSKWQVDAVQAADTHRGLAARGRETEKKKRGRPEERKVREDQQLKKELGHDYSVVDVMQAR